VIAIKEANSNFIVRLIVAGLTAKGNSCMLPRPGERSTR
jgi:hypothetical protein